MEKQDEISKMFKSTFDLSDTMKDAVKTAVPIWEIMKMTEEEFTKKQDNTIFDKFRVEEKK